MTLVARFKVENWPIILGDVLVSGKPLPNIRIALPTLRDTSSITNEKSGNVPRGLKQKLTLIGENVVVGWAGNSESAAIIVDHLNRCRAESNLTKDSLFACLSKIDEQIWQDVGITGYIIDVSGITSFGRGKSFLEFDSTSYGIIGLLGSGATDIRKVFSRINTPIKSSADANIAQRAVATALSLAGNALGQEISNHDSLKQFYGAGYEIASLSGGRFIKVDDLMYVFWKVKISNNRRTVDLSSKPFHISHYKYNDDILVVGDIDIDKERGSTEIVCPIPPVDADYTLQELDDTPAPSYDPQWICNVILLQGEHLDGLNLIHVEARPERHDPSWIHLIRTGDWLHTFTEERLVMEIARLVREELTGSHKA